MPHTPIPEILIFHWAREVDVSRQVDIRHRCLGAKATTHSVADTLPDLQPRVPSGLLLHPNVGPREADPNVDKSLPQGEF